MNSPRVVVVAVFALASLAHAQVPQLLGYQGRLLTGSGAPVTGMKDVRFTLHSAESAGTLLWSESQTLGLSDGYYSTSLGVTGPTAGSTLEAALSAGTAWLEIAFKDAAATTFDVLSPRQRLGSVAYALNAKALSGGIVNATSVQVNGTTVIDATGSLVGPAALRADAGTGIEVTGNNVRLQSCTNTGDWLRWNGTGWSCATTPIVSLTGTAPINVTAGEAPTISVAPGSASSLGVVQLGTGLSVDGGVTTVVYGETSGTAVPGDLIIRTATTFMVGPTGRFADLNAAFTFLNTKILVADVTLQLSNGTHAYATTVNASHPQGEHIIIRGDPNNAANVVISFPQGSTGIAVNASRLGNIIGVTLTTSHLSTVGAGVYVENGGRARVDSTVRVQNFAYGVAANASSSCVANGVQVSRPGGGGGSAGFQAAYSSHVYAVNASSSGYSYNFSAIYGATIEATGAVATGGAYGFVSQYSSMMVAANTTATGQSTNGHYAASNATMIVTGANSSSYNPAPNTSGNNNGFMSP